MLQVNGCASGLTMYCSRILRMVRNYFTGGTYQFLMIVEHMLTLPTSALITLHCVFKKRCLEIFGSLCKQLCRFLACTSMGRGLYRMNGSKSARLARSPWPGLRAWSSLMPPTPHPTLDLQSRQFCFRKLIWASSLFWHQVYPRRKRWFTSQPMRN